MSPLRVLVDRLATSRCSSILIDASLLTSVDDEGVAALRGLWSAMQTWGKRIDLYGASGPVARALKPIGRG
ncbi:MAG TPA: hypothetical protein VHV57_17470 [Acidimicrobiales bacterium]|nr:hypothetical protein [Acidimicrobiales bacterium]